MPDARCALTCRSRCAFRCWREQSTVAEMTSFLLPVVTGVSPTSDPLQLAVAAHLARCRGLSRGHTASDFRKPTRIRITVTKPRR
jgi:hypothetical protein